MAGLAWLGGVFIVHTFLDTHSVDSAYLAHDPTGFLLLLAAVTTAVHVGCELVIAKQRGPAYPALGMWAWVTSPSVRAVLDRGRQAGTKIAGSGCAIAILAALSLPLLFIAVTVVATLSAAALMFALYFAIGAHTVITVIRIVR